LLIIGDDGMFFFYLGAKAVISQSLLIFDDS
jgi:hypothetical protein